MKQSGIYESPTTEIAVVEIADVLALSVGGGIQDYNYEEYDEE